MTNLKKTRRPKIVKEKRGAQSKSSVGRVKNYVIQELVQKAIAILQRSASDLDTEELYVLLQQEYRKLNQTLFASVLDRLMKDNRVAFDGERKTLRHRDNNVSEGIIVINPNGLPVIIDNKSGERYTIDDYGLYFPGDVVRYAEHYGEPKVLEILERPFTEVLGLIKTKPRTKGRTKIVFKAFDPRLSEIRFEVFGTDAELAAWSGKKVVTTIERYPDENNPVAGLRIERELEVSNDSELEIEIAVRQFGIPAEFSPGTIREAEAIPDKVKARDRARRVDLRDVAFCTIDGEDARDFDDAVYAEQLDEEHFRLLVAIADVSHYVKPATDLDHDAQLRSTSVYFPRRVVPMLPEKLSNGICSLNPEVDRLTMVCDMVIDQLGTVNAYQFYPAVICSKARLTYTSVWEYLSGVTEKNVPDFMRERLDHLYALYKILHKARGKRGAMDFYARETQVLTDENGEVVAITARETNDAHRLIEEAMLVANTCASDFIGRHKKTSLYRIHDAPVAERLSQLRQTLAGFNLSLAGGSKPSAADYEAVVKAVEGKPYAEAVQMALLRSMQRAVYSPDNIGHYGLGYDAYTHFTSPIRRYPDLLVHRTIRGILSRRTYRPTVYSASTSVLATVSGQNVERTFEAQNTSKDPAKRDPSYGDWTLLGKITSACERRADEASRDVTAWLKCRYMATHADYKKEYSARITSITSFGAYVELDEIFVEGFIHISNLGFDYYDFTEFGTLKGRDFGDEFAVGDRVKVRLMGVDEERRRIDFLISSTVEDKPQTKRR